MYSTVTGKAEKVKKEKKGAHLVFLQVSGVVWRLKLMFLQWEANLIMQHLLRKMKPLSSSVPHSNIYKARLHAIVWGNPLDVAVAKFKCQT